MADPGARFGFDFVTTLVGSGLTLLLTAGIIRYGDRFQWTTTELYALGGGGLLVVGLLFGIVLAATGSK
ncbi:hypothetical protein [Halococcus saccharolyticus]|uniref:Uncharacterized protein n=1 Tax=Halococcus saccharolyticus DSM 5350 TaxID=1227455 RepID=M0MJT9_9EURY|nr:hypothetical protein [Halococcus saccharolyticus]EMA44715.1 hypothetical protein C449_08659 [Halococcus saccharolyticus DSM 5350]